MWVDLAVSNKQELMKILFMADVKPDPNSGAAGTEVQTLKELEKLNVKIDSVWSKDLSHYIEHGNLHYLLELPISLRSQLKKRLGYRQYDVIHVNQPHGFLAAKEIKKIMTILFSCTNLAVLYCE